MKVPKFRGLDSFIRFRRIWMVSNAQDRARMIQHVNTVLSAKSKKNVLFLARKTQHQGTAENKAEGVARLQGS